MTPAQVQKLTPRMTPLSWGDVRERLDRNEQAIGAALANCNVLHTAIGYTYDDTTKAHSSARIDRLAREQAAFRALSLWGRLVWLVTGVV